MTILQRSNYNSRLRIRIKNNNKESQIARRRRPKLTTIAITTIAIARVTLRVANQSIAIATTIT